MTTALRPFAFGSLLALSLCARSANASVELGVGLMGTLGGNFQNKPDRTPYDPDLNPGFGGMTAGGGFLVDVRILKGLLGLEVDALRTSDRGAGTVRFTGLGASAEYKVHIGQSAWHVPILPKLTFPSPVVAPMFFLGPEVVIPSDGEASLEGPGAPSGFAHAKADTYVMITGGGGVEIKVPLPVLDLRIPIGIRGSYNPSLSSKYADRTKMANNGVATTGITYDSAWKFAVNFTLGAALYF